MSSLLSESGRISLLNDFLRRRHQGGTVVISRGIAALDRSVWADVITAVAEFNDFTPENDPYGEHDCAVVELGELKIIWKIDYYDPTMMYHSDDPTDPRITRRVMTIMLAEEY